ncbi:MAG: GNAT family N-acetyltransferase [Coriobacteriales bacterium]|nr:GNAT family N-acetyltransferase [Coriobacteriales bacterium]
MHIRQAVSADVDSIMDLYDGVSTAMVGTPYDCRWRRGGHPSREFVSGLVLDEGMLVAFEGDTLVGAVGTDHDLGHDYGELPWLCDVPDHLVAVIHLLVVREGWRGGGISRQLLAACLNVARARGMRTARLDATANNAPAIALYLSEGFYKVGEGVQDVGPRDDPHVPFVVLERVL